MGIKPKIKRSVGYDFVPIKQAFEDFILEKEVRNLSPATINSYRETFTAFCKFFEVDNDTDITTITQQDIFKWINTMKIEGLSPASINHYLAEIRAFLYWCMEEPRTYLERFKVVLIEKQEEPPKLFTDDEIMLLLEKPKRNDSFVTWRTWAIVNWVLGTGNRAGTIVEVRLTDVNYSKKEITLRHTKNKSTQIIPLSSSLENSLKEYIRMWRKEAPIGGYLFCNIGEEQLTTNGLRQAFTKYCGDRGVNRHNIHGLRHNFAKGWVQNNGNMFALQKILGHSTLDMTRKYVRLFAEDIKEDYDKYSPLDTIKRSTKRTQTVKRS